MRISGTLFIPAALLVAMVAANSACAQQKFIPKTIQFKGAPEYQDDELMAAAGLKKGEVLTSPDVNQRSQKLMDTGLFDNLTFTFDGQDLVFKLVPSPQVVPVKLVNFPFPAGPELDAKIRAAVPLYRGKVPAEGGMLEAVRSALEDELKSKGVSAVVVAAPTVDSIQHNIGAVSFSITSPSVVVGDVVVDPATPLDKDAAAVVARIPGKPLDSDGSRPAIEKYVADSYQDKGYLDAEVHATQQPELVIEAHVVHVPFRISVHPGEIYRVSSIRLAPGLIVSQTDFDKVANVHAGDVADAIHIQRNWDYISRQYHNRGFMKAHIRPEARLDRAARTVEYQVSAEPGEVYTMGALSIDNADPGIQSVVKAAWPVEPGAVFNEGALVSITATHGVHPEAERLFSMAILKYRLRLNDETRTVDVALRLEKRP